MRMDIGLLTNCFSCAAVVLGLPTCVLCTTRVQADLRCLQPDCGAYNKPLCSKCSDSCHSSENARTHRHSVTSSAFAVGGRCLIAGYGLMG